MAAESLEERKLLPSRLKPSFQPLRGASPNWATWGAGMLMTLSVEQLYIGAVKTEAGKGNSWTRKGISRKQLGILMLRMKPRQR